MSHPTVPDLSAFQALAALIAPGEEILISIRRQPLGAAPTEVTFATPVAPTVLVAESPAPAPTVEVLTTPLARARRIAEATPDRVMNASVWAREIGYSARELGRARDAGAIPHQRRGLTRGHNGKQIAATDLVWYLETIDAVETGEQAAPRWYAEVRRKR